MLSQWRGAQEAMREQSTQNDQKDFPHHSASYAIYKLGRIVQERWITSQHHSQGMMNTDILHHSFLLGFAPVSYMLFSLAAVVMIVIILLLYFCLFQILNSYLHGFYLLLILFPIPSGWVWEGASNWMVFSCCLCLKCNSKAFFRKSLKFLHFFKW